MFIYEMFGMIKLAVRNCTLDVLAQLLEINFIRVLKFNVINCVNYIGKLRNETAI